MRAFTQSLHTFFKLEQHGSHVRREGVAGLTSFLTMAYIILVNPAILGQTGMDSGAVFMATCLAAAVGSLLMGLLSNFPIGVAPSMGLNSYFAFVIVKQMGYDWHIALGAVVITGALFFLLTLFKVRRLLISAIPEDICTAISVGIGLFIGLIALHMSGLIAPSSVTLVTLGALNHAPVYLFMFGFIAITCLDYHKVPGAILLGILMTTALGILLGKTPFQGIIALPPSLQPTLGQFDLHPLLSHRGFTVVFTCLLVVLFDSTGTLIGLMHQHQPISAPEHQHKLGLALMAGSLATFLAGCLGTSPTSPYVESAAGMRAGGRTGLTAVVIGLCFLAATCFSPLSKTIPNYATAPALLYVACLMMKNITAMHWNDLSNTIPGMITLILIPLTFSIADGIGLGLISFVAIKIGCGRWRDLNPTLLVVTALFLTYFIAHGH